VSIDPTGGGTIRPTPPFTSVVSPTRHMRILVANTGSSSLKLRVVDGADRVAATVDLPAPSDPVDAEPISDFLERAGHLDAVGHRVVHGGREFTEPVLLDGSGIERLATLGDLAPLHNGPALRVLEAIRRLRPDLPQVACFDTAFHAGIPEEAALYALPREWIERHGLRRFGFHGISHSWASRRAAQLLDRSLAELRLVTCHLGAGASLAAVRDGRSVDTTMGFTPNEGLVMATRSGSVDPGLLLWLIRHAGVSPDDLERALEHESGLRGLSGGSGDMRELLAAREHDDAARTALAVYLHRLRASIAAMAAAIDGLDALVFTGGVGEHAPAVRAGTCAGLGFLGIRLDEARNQAHVNADEDVAEPGSAVRVLVVESREELEIAGSVRSALAG
jgi:acetate kinase